MVAKLRSHLSYANVMATIAVFIALGGGAYAALKLPRNSVGPAQIKANAISSSKVKPRSLLASDFRRGQLPRGQRGPVGAQGPQGALGPQGAQGPRGVTGPTGADGTDGTNGTNGTTGPTGAAGVVGTVIVRRVNVALTAGSPGPEASGFAQCQPGEKIIGGAANVSASPESELLVDRPSTDNVGSGGYPADGAAFPFWKGTARNLNNTGTTELRIFALCAPAP